MPIYVYECQCGRFDALQSVSDTPLTQCPEGHPARRVVAPLGFVSTTNPDKERREADRRHKTNKEVAEGLAKGTMTPPEDRDVCGDKQPRSSVAEFNSIYDHAKRMK